MNLKIATSSIIGLIAMVSSAITPADALGQFSAFTDIGSVKYSGAMQYNEADQQYKITSPGNNMSVCDQQLHYAYTQMNGDFIVSAQVAFEHAAVTSRREMGWNLRASLDAESAHVSATVDGDGLAALQFRAQARGDIEQYSLQVKFPDVLQLERRGDVYIFSAAKKGEPLQITAVSHLKFNKKVYVGLSLCSHNSGAAETAIFSNVRITIPAAKNFTPYKDYIGSNLEILDLKTGNRRIVFRSSDSIQAPNWTQDGKSLIYNSKGLLYNFDIESGKPVVINTGFANSNNNDHVLSWDGKQLGISSHVAEDDNNSTLYTLPIKGSSKPLQINATGAGHSYLHGFSPDDKKLVFTGQRNNVFNIFTIDLKTKQEVQLTSSPALDDGAEYTPDGKYIYFNSNRTGLMQLWRMLADGSQQEQVTFDDHNNWFPHIAPDGKKIVFLSYMTDIDPDEHPFYRHVYLREMPIEGGAAKIIAYVYGGQGTINVPSWSPDSSKIAFVSNTQQ
jgi:TolB protein